ncbi:hypothetical protein AB0F88_13330 [Streptosporangium sp. NPDC023963]|uniref:hypothetical protein n=1 Tax=Streptosporangium sp. NPDC023963 TaxID=3155608 RepID=UPI003427E7A1
MVWKIVEWAGGEVSDGLKEHTGLYRPRIVQRVPRSIPDERSNDLFAQLGSHRDRALMMYPEPGAIHPTILDNPPPGQPPEATPVGPHLSALMPSLFAKYPTPEELVTLPGVGRETANVEFGNSFGRLR